MKVTYHAGQRFLERVIEKTDYSKYEVHRTVEYLERAFKDIVVTGYARRIALPGFESDYYVVQRENTVITVIPKRD